MNARVGVLLAALAGLPGALRAAEPPGPIARSVERAVATLDAPAPDRARPTLCGTGCAALETAQEKSDRPYMSGALASGVGLAGLSAGLGLGKPDEGAGLPALRGGWQTADTVVAGTTLAAWITTRVLDHAPEALASSRSSDCDGGLGLAERPRPAHRRGLGRRALAPERIRDQRHDALGRRRPRGRAGGRRAAGRARPRPRGDGRLVVNAAVHDVARRFFDRPRPCAHFCRLHGPATPRRTPAPPSTPATPARHSPWPSRPGCSATTTATATKAGCGRAA